MANTTGKKYGGREKGTPNRLTKELRSILKDDSISRIRTHRRRLERIRTKRKIRTCS